MNFILDTNVCASLMKGEPATLAALRSAGRPNVSIPQPVVAEVCYGLERLPNSARRSLLELKWALLSAELGRIPWTDAVSQAFGRIKATLELAGRRIEDMDAAIGAHALATGAVLVTSNTKHLARIAGLEVVDWTES